MMISPTAIELRDSIREYLQDSEWSNILSMYMSGPDILRAIEHLRTLKENGFSFIPTLKNSWNWLMACPYSTIKVVMLIDHIASSGIPLSVVYGNPSRLEGWIFESIDKKYEGSQNLDRWCKQGVLMMPLSLTRTDYMEGNTHYKIWEPLIIYMIHKINEGYPDVPWVVIGQKGIPMLKRVKSKNKTVVTIKPVQANDSWNYVNSVLRKQNKSEIIW